MNRACPGLNIVDMNTSIQWYQDFLGYECTFRVPTSEAMSPYAIVSKNNICIHLLLDTEGSLAGTGFCYIETDDVTGLYEELLNNGVIFVRDIEDSSYGMKDFVIKDYEGNKISFGSKIT